ncbi:MAG: AAA domain-containing protein [Chitinivibrionales bacterium]|nr:AAA domain-containing protein [Chitinivibrionales bacterium]MBD3397274.1 AAA domain-containing protein [Chitinivibrionales bacterium]
MAGSPNDVRLLEDLHIAAESIVAELHKRIVEQDAVIADLLASFLAGGHCLLIGVPGLAKTMLVQSLAQCLDLEFNRVQFTPDLMPADITGSEILFEDKATGNREFRFVKGPIFSNIVLADEINRTPPKTQSALLQAMQEREVTSSGRTWPLPAPFWVLATQNPIEQEGTYPLPEAQQDRFMFSIEIDYPGAEAEAEIVKTTTVPQTTDLGPVLDGGMLGRFRDLILRVPVADSVVEYAVRLSRATRPADASCPDSIRKLVTWGAGPRASQFLVLAAKAYAALEGRPTPDAADIRRAAYPVLRHRLVRSFHAEVEGVSANDLIGRLLDAIR